MFYSQNIRQLPYVVVVRDLIKVIQVTVMFGKYSLKKYKSGAVFGEKLLSWWMHFFIYNLSWAPQTFANIIVKSSTCRKEHLSFNERPGSCQRLSTCPNRKCFLDVPSCAFFLTFNTSFIRYTVATAQHQGAPLFSLDGVAFQKGAACFKKKHFKLYRGL